MNIENSTWQKIVKELYIHDGYGHSGTGEFCNITIHRLFLKIRHFLLALHSWDSSSSLMRLCWRLAPERSSISTIARSSCFMAQYRGVRPLTSLRSTSAPLSTSILTILLLPAFAAQKRGVWPLESLQSTPAPFSIRSSAIDSSPFHTAACSGVPVFFSKHR